jgi:hypothetical protein
VQAALVESLIGFLRPALVEPDRAGALRVLEGFRRQSG